MIYSMQSSISIWHNEAINNISYNKEQETVKSVSVFQPAWRRTSRTYLPIVCIFGFYSITENTRQSFREIDFVQMTKQMHLSLTLPLLYVPCIFYPFNLANRHLSCVRFVPISFSFHDKLIVPILAGKSILYNLINDRSESSFLVTSKLSYLSR